MGVEILSVDTLAANRDAFQIVDARRNRDFLAGHLPGAIRMGWETWCEPAPVPDGSPLSQKGYWGKLAPQRESWYVERLAAAGFRSDRPTVVYGDGPRSRGREGRIAWMLLYLGVERVYLLDGGWRAWLDMGGHVEMEGVVSAADHLTISFQPQRRCTLDELRQGWHSGSMPVLVDTRSPPEFAGEIQPYLPRRGHLPGAHLVPFADLFDRDGRYVTAEVFGDRLRKEVQEAGEVVAYCEVGVRASLFAMLHEAYTGRVVRVFDGSLMQWSLDNELPCVKT